MAEPQCRSKHRQGLRCPAMPEPVIDVIPSGTLHWWRRRKGQEPVWLAKQCQRVAGCLLLRWGKSTGSVHHCGLQYCSDPLGWPLWLTVRGGPAPLALDAAEAAVEGDVDCIGPLSWSLSQIPEMKYETRKK